MYTLNRKQWMLQAIEAEKWLIRYLEEEQKELATQGLEMVHIIDDEYEIRPITKTG